MAAVISDPVEARCVCWFRSQSALRRTESHVHVERDRVLCRHRGCAVVVLADVPPYEEEKHLPAVFDAVAACEDVLCVSSSDDQEDGGEMSALWLLLGAVERGPCELGMPEIFAEY